MSIDEVKFVDKLLTFRKHYKEMYYLILIVPSSIKDRVERDYPDIYDEIVEGEDIPKLLYDLRKNLE